MTSGKKDIERQIKDAIKRVERQKQKDQQKEQRQREKGFVASTYLMGTLLIIIIYFILCFYFDNDTADLILTVFYYLIHAKLYVYCSSAASHIFTS